MKNEKNVGWALYWVGYALCFGMNIAERGPEVRTAVDAGVNIAISFVLSFTSWIGVGVNIIQLAERIINAL